MTGLEKKQFSKVVGDLTRLRLVYQDKQDLIGDFICDTLEEDANNPQVMQQLRQAVADIVTLGNNAYEAMDLLNNHLKGE